MKDKKEVFILGSGFSRFVNPEMPLLNDLTESIKKEIQNSEYKIYKEIYEDIFRGRPSNLFNFEQILTYLYQDFPWKSAQELHLSKSLYFHITKLLDSVIRNFQMRIDLSDLAKSPIFRKLVNYLHVSDSKIITFNYDTILEDLCLKALRPKRHKIERTFSETKIEKIELIKDWNNKETCKETPFKIIKKSDAEIIVYVNNYNVTKDEWSRVVDGFSTEEDSLPIKIRLSELYDHDIKQQLIEKKLGYFDLYPFPINPILRRTHGTFSRNRIKTMEILKLHGSINWYYSGEQGNGGEQLYLSSFRGDEEIEINLKDLFPLIIPPVLDKVSYYKHNTLKTMWNEAKNSLLVAEKVYVIGYSIPETDLTVKFMLQKYIPKDCSVFIVNYVETDKKNEEIDRMKRFFGDNIVTKYILENKEVIAEFVDKELIQYE